MPQDTNADKLGPGPSMLLPSQELPAGARRAYSSGPDKLNAGNGRTVAYAIRVRADLKVGEREFSGEITMHEFAAFKRFYEELNGSVRLEPGWPPGLNRLVPLSQEQLSTELARMRGAFVVPRTNAVFEVLPLFLGAEPAGQLTRLHDLMRRQVEAWGKLVEKAKARVPAKGRPTDAEELLALACDHITARELEEIANMGDPSRDGVGELELPEALVPTPAAAPAAPTKAQTLEEIEAAVNAEAQAPDAHSDLIGKLKKEGLDETQAVSIASLVDLTGETALADDDIIHALGSKAKLAAVKRALKG